MFATIGRSFRLIGESYRVLRQDPELIWLTVGSFAAVLVLALLFGGFGLGFGAFDPANQTVSGLGIVLFALGYLASYFVIIYFQVALVAAVLHRMEGGDPSISYALNQANQRLGPIFTWAIIAATVGLILRALEGMARDSDSAVGRIVGSIVINLLGFAWGLMVFFVVPVIVVERTSGLTAIKRSSSTLKQRWGEAIVGNQGVGLVVLLAVLVLAGIPVLLGLAVMGSASAIGVTLIAIGVGIGVFLVAGGAALDATYRAVLYRYATAGDTGRFAPEVLESAFRPKQDIRRSGGYGSI